MITQEQYEQAKKIFLEENNHNLTAIGKQLNINRKELSILLKKDGLFEGKGYTRRQIQAAEVLLNNNFTFSEICGLFHVDKTRFARELEKQNIRQMGIGHSLYDYNSAFCLSILHDYQNGIERSKIMNKYQIHDGLLYRILEFHNIPLDESHRRTFTFNERFFETIDTEEKAYWLGFLYADGYVYNNIGYAVELTLKREDESHLIKFKTLLGYNGELEEKNVELNKKIFPAKRLTLCSKSMVQDLVSKGCFQCKSLDLKFPTIEQVPQHLIHHFMRGYFDGDGSISISSNHIRKDLHFSILGTYSFLQSFENNLNGQYINKKEPKITKSKAYIVQHSGNRQCRDIYNFLYNNATIFLKRKRDIFIAVLGQNSQKT